MIAIDREALKKSISEYAYNNPHEYGVTIEIIDAAPTIDAAPVVRGKWEKSNHGNGYMWCSRCHGFALEIQEFEELSNYCPNCGACMKEV